MTGTPTWRMAVADDSLFAYELATALDPRWWRFSRHGLHPHTAMEVASGIAAGATVLDGDGRPVALAVLVETGTTGTGTFEYYALPGTEETARRMAPDLVAAAFAGAPIRRLYHERFEGDPEVLGPVAELFEVEVKYPQFALLDGKYETRCTSVLTRERFDRWWAQRGGR